MKHISREHIFEVASVAGEKYRDLDGKHLLSADESEHLRGCPECTDALGNAIREIIRNRGGAAGEMT